MNPKHYLSKELIKGHIWINGYENKYSINKDGEVYSYIWSSREPHLMKPNLTKTGYYKVHLSQPRKKIFIHRLVAIAFISNPNSCLLYTSPSPRD